MRQFNLPTRLAFFFCLFFNFIFGQWTPTIYPGSSIAIFRVIHQNGVWLTISDYGVFRSTDNGHRWQLKHQEVFGGYSLNVTFAGQNTVFLKTQTEMLQSDDLGATWKKFAEHPDEYQSGSLAATDEYLFFSNENTVWRYDRSQGASGNAPRTKVLTSISNNWNRPVRVQTENQRVWAATTDSLLVSDDGGATWQPKLTGIPIYSFDVYNGTLIVYTGGSLRRSTDGGASWQTSQISGASDTEILALSDGTWFLKDSPSTSPAKAQFSEDGGLTWKKFKFGETNELNVSAIERNGSVWISNGPYNAGPLVSEDNGNTWVYRQGGILDDQSLPWGGFPIEVVHDYLFINGAASKSPGDDWFVPTDEEANWLGSSNGRTVFFQGHFLRVVNYSPARLARWDEKFENLTTFPSPVAQLYYQQLLTTEDRLFLSEIANDGSGNVYLWESTDLGETWQQVNSLPGVSAWNIFTHKKYLCLWNPSKGLSRSADGGKTWQSVGAGLGDYSDVGGHDPEFFSAGNRLFVFDYSNISVSENDGLTFRKFNTTLLGFWGGAKGANYFFANNEWAICAHAQDGIYITPLGSLNSPDSWTNITANFNPDYIGLGSGTGEGGGPAIFADQIFMVGYYSPEGLYSRPISSLNIAKLEGTVYSDDNQNGQRDAGEAPLEGVVVKGGSTFYTTKTDGQFSMHADLSPDTLKVFNPGRWAVVSPPFYQVSSSVSGKDFGLYKTPNITDLGVDLTDFTVFRPGFDEQVRLGYANRGSLASDGKLKCHVAAPLEFKYASILPDQIVDDTLIWDLKNLPDGFESGIDIEVTLPPTATLGDHVYIFAQIQPNLSDAWPDDNHILLDQIIVGSYDPNDKRCSPDEHITPEQIQNREPLTYTIRFQNTGTYTAEIVRITDTLDFSTLDIGSFQLLSTSHPCEMSLSGRGNVSFLFKNIDLPPSSWNEPASHGFVKFQIHAHDTLPLNRQIRNTAFIYFDFNPPIITNTTRTRVGYPVSSFDPSEKSGRLVVYPNPNAGQFWVKTPPDALGRLRVFDYSGKLIFEKNTTNSGTEFLDLGTAAAGFYSILWQSANSESMRIGKVFIQK